MWRIHHVSENLILNKECSQKYNYNENIHVDNRHHHRAIKLPASIVICFYHISLNLIRSSNVQGCVKREHRNGSKPHRLQAVELSQQPKTAVQIVSNLPDPSNGGLIYRFWACRPCGPAGWLALLLTKAGDVEINPGPTTLNKRV